MLSYSNIKTKTKSDIIKGRFHNFLLDQPTGSYYNSKYVSSNKRAFKYIKQSLTEIKGEIDKSTSIKNEIRKLNGHRTNSVLIF